MATVVSAPRMGTAAFVCLVCVVCLTSLLTGCANLPPSVTPSLPATTTAAPPQPSATERTIGELVALSALPATELAAARESAREAFERDTTEARRRRYLLTLIASPPSPSDDDRIINLSAYWLMTSPSSSEPPDDATRVLATLAEQAALERKRLRAEQAALRSRNATLQQTARRDERDAELRTLRARIEELEKQLLVMKSIDRSVARR